MTRLYISGGMTSYPQHNFPAFRAATVQLMAAGFEVEDPSVQGIVEGWAWEDYIRADLKVMLTCDGVATLPGWHESRGANLEVLVAEALKMPIKPLAQWLERRTV